MFTIERQYLVPNYQHLQIAAETPEEAMHAAMDETAYPWDGDKIDYESARPHYIVGAWEGEAYASDELPIPADLAQPANYPLAAPYLAAVAALESASRALIDAFGTEMPSYMEAEAGAVENALAGLEIAKSPVLPTLASSVGGTLSDVDQVLNFAEAFVLHWETDEGQSLKEQREADNARILLDRTGPMILDAFMLICGGPEHRLPLARVLIDAQTVLQACAETGPEELQNDAVESIGFLGAAITRMAELGAAPFHPIKIVADITGGILQGASSTVPVELWTVDYETDGCDDDEIFEIDQGENGRTAQGHLVQHDPDVNPDWVGKVVVSISLADEEKELDAQADALDAENASEQ
jgi:hypothetical protein